MDRARKSLARSDGGRKGRRTYARDAEGPQDFRPMRGDDDRDSVPGGALFSTLLRHSTMETERCDEERSLAGHAQKEAEPHRYFGTRYPRSTGAMPPDPLTIRKLRPDAMRSMPPTTRLPKKKKRSAFLTALSNKTGVRDEPSVQTMASAKSRATYGPEWFIDKHDLLINRHTTASRLSFPPPSKKVQPGVSAQASVVSQITQDDEFLARGRVCFRRQRFLDERREAAFPISSKIGGDTE